MAEKTAAVAAGGAAAAGTNIIKDEKFEEHVIHLLEEIEMIPRSCKEVFFWDLIHMSMGDLMKHRVNTLPMRKRPYTREILRIKVLADRENNKLYIIDTGAGRKLKDLMYQAVDISVEDVELFKENIAKYMSDGNPSDYYNQPGGIVLGFYAAFMVAKRVVITTREEFADDMLVWDANGLNHDSDDDAGTCSGSYRISRVPYDGKLFRGTITTVYLKHEYAEYLAEEKLLSLVGLLESDHCPYPIDVFVDGGWHSRSFLYDGGVDIALLVENFKPLKLICEEALGKRVEEVVITDRVFDFPFSLSADEKRFEINPRSQQMNLLLQNCIDPGKRERIVAMFEFYYHLCAATTHPEPLPEFVYNLNHEKRTP